jgi:peptidoglycan/xylan/chitin deacetylase (PgdA/CDA1 family)
VSGSSLVRTAVATACLPWSTLASAARPGVRVLMYHRVFPRADYDQLTVTPERFAEQMQWLSQHFEVVSLSDAVSGLGQGNGRQRVAITFDDGYRDNLQHALPVLQRLRLPATIFITTSFCSQAMRHPRYPAVDGQLHLTWDEVRVLASAPGITIGSHTATHPYLQRISNEQVRAEIGDSRKCIEDEIGRPVEFFCYPSGDVGPREIEAARAAGYRASVTVAPGLNRAGIDLQALRRTEITQHDGPTDFALKLRGGYDPIHALLHWRRQRRFASQAQAALQSAKA